MADPIPFPRPSSSPGLPPELAAVPPFVVDGWRFEPVLHRASRDGRVETLEPRILHVLACLAARPGDVLTRQQLLDTVWGEVHVGEEVLTRAISQLRQLLDDDPRTPRVIETIRGGGYRLVAPVEDSSPAEVAVDARRAGPLPGHRRRSWVAALAVAAMASAVAVVTLRGPGAPAPSAVLLATPLTSYPGLETFPAASPVTDAVAFVWQRDGDNDLFVIQPGAEQPLRLTAGPGQDLFPTWSPDGHRIAFSRTGENGTTIMVVPAIGGAPQPLLEVPSPIYGMAWPADGSRLLLAAAVDEPTVSRLYALDLSGHTLRALTRPDPATHLGDSQPAVSTDGRRLAFVRCDHAGLQDLWLGDPETGTARQLTSGLRLVSGLSWTADGAAVIVAAAPDGRSRLYRIDPETGDRQWLPTTEDDCLRPTISAASGALVFVARTVDADLWRYDLDDPGTPPVAVAPSTRLDRLPAPSPDGRRLAFMSERSGSPQVWLAAADGGSPRPLTTDPVREVQGLHWSPDGRRLAFSTLNGDRVSIVLADVDGGAVSVLPPRHRHEVVRGWWPDGRWLVVEVDRSTGWELHRVGMDGSDGGTLGLGDSELTRLEVSGSWLYLSRRGRSEVLRRRLDGDSETVVVPEGVAAGWRFWLPGPGGLLFQPREPADAPLRWWDPDRGRAGGPVGIPLPPDAREVALSAAGDALCVTRLGRSGADLMRVAGF